MLNQNRFESEWLPLIFGNEESRDDLFEPAFAVGRFRKRGVWHCDLALLAGQQVAEFG